MKPDLDLDVCVYEGTVGLKIYMGNPTKTLVPPSPGSDTLSHVGCGGSDCLGPKVLTALDRPWSDIARLRNDKCITDLSKIKERLSFQKLRVLAMQSQCININLFFTNKTWQ